MFCVDPFSTFSFRFGITYDSAVDILRIAFSDTPKEARDEVIAGIVVDYDTDGKIVGVEVLDATKRGNLESVHKVLGLKNVS